MQRNVIRVALRPSARPRGPTRTAAGAGLIIAKQNLSSSSPLRKAQPATQRPPHPTEPGELRPASYYNAPSIFHVDHSPNELAQAFEPVDQEFLRVNRRHLRTAKAGVEVVEKSLNEWWPGEKIAAPEWAPDLPAYERGRDVERERAESKLEWTYDTLARLDWHLRDFQLLEYCRPTEGYRKEETEKWQREVKANFDAKMASGMTTKEIFRGMRDAEQSKRERLERMVADANKQLKAWGEKNEKVKAAIEKREQKMRNRGLSSPTDGASAMQDYSFEDYDSMDRMEDIDDLGEYSEGEKRAGSQSRQKMSRDKTTTAETTKGKTGAQQVTVPSRSHSAKVFGGKKPAAKPLSLQDKFKQMQGLQGLKKAGDDTRGSGVP